jgi:SAM-dependent methyltransferase
MYDPARIHDLSLSYPANYFRLQLLKKSFADVNDVIDVGCGDGSVMLDLKNSGKTVRGFDISPKMVEETKAKGLTAYVVDITEAKPGEYGGLVATGVMPHIEDDSMALAKMLGLLKKGGKAFIEFRNSLFSLYTMNRLTVSLFLDDLVSPTFHDAVGNDLTNRLHIELPKERPYDKIPAKFHNPFEVLKTMESIGFKDCNILWYHYHVAPPFAENWNARAFREEAISLEGTESWKSPFVCSAFVVEAYCG